MNTVALEHLSLDGLEELLLGSICDGAKVEKIEEHLLFCSQCQDALLKCEVEIVAMPRALKLWLFSAGGADRIDFAQYSSVCAATQ